MKLKKQIKHCSLLLNKKALLHAVLFYYQIFLLRSEYPVAGVAQTGADIGVLVELSVQMADVDLNVGVRLGQHLEALGSGDDAHEFYALSALLLNKGDSVDGGAAGGQHGVQDYDGALIYAFRKLAVIFMGDVGLGVAVHSDVAHLGVGDEL